jgi:hypothetical protein
MKIIYILGFLLILVSNVIKGQISDSIFSDIYSSSISTIDNFKNIEYDYTDSIFSDGFDFEQIKPISITKNKRSKYTSYYKNEELLKVKQIEKSKKRIIVFYFWNKHNYTIYISCYQEMLNPQFKLVDVSGFFLNYKSTQKNYFIGIETDNRLNQGLIYDDKLKGLRQMFFSTDSIPNTESIKTIMLFDKTLKPKSRLNFYKNKLISYSEFISEPEKFCEILFVYNNFNPLNSLNICKFEDLDRLLMDYDEENVVLRILVELNKEFQNYIWTDPTYSWGYKY